MPSRLLSYSSVQLEDILSYPIKNWLSFNSETHEASWCAMRQCSIWFGFHEDPLAIDRVWSRLGTSKTYPSNVPRGGLFVDVRALAVRERRVCDL